MPRFSFTEPHPSVPQSGAYLYGGRGGAGNYKRYNSSDLTQGPSATGPASRTNLTKPAGPRRTVTAGRGGAGNMLSHDTTPEEPMFLFDEELLRQRDARAPVYHIGRGGAANWAKEETPNMERKNSAASDVVSTTSRESTASAARRSAERVLGVFGRRPS